MPVSIRLDQDIEHRLGVLATTTHRSKSFYLRQLITEGLEDLEDAYRASIVLAKVRSGEETMHSLAETKALLGLDA